MEIRAGRRPSLIHLKCRGKQAIGCNCDLFTANTAPNCSRKRGIAIISHLRAGVTKALSHQIDLGIAQDLRTGRRFHGGLFQTHVPPQRPSAALTRAKLELTKARNRSSVIEKLQGVSFVVTQGTRRQGHRFFKSQPAHGRGEGQRTTGCPTPRRVVLPTVSPGIRAGFPADQKRRHTGVNGPGHARPDQLTRAD